MFNSLKLNDSKESLPSCPFCGAEAWVEDMSGYESGCSGCGALGPTAPSGDREEAVSLWSSRSIISAEEKRILQKNIDDYLYQECVMSRASLDIIGKLLD